MRKLLAIGLLIGLVHSIAAAETVYLRDGRNIEGQVTRSGDKVIVETSAGRQEFDAADVIHVSPSASTSQPASGSSSQPVAATGGATTLAAMLPMPLEHITRPETMVFQLMRRLATSVPGTESLELRQQIETWRAAIHERKRQISGNWVPPRDFARRRDLFVSTVKDANKDYQDALRKSKTPSAGHVDLNPALNKMRQVAGTWEDPVIKNFLLAITEYQAGNYQQADMAFTKLHMDEPAFAVFAQGEATSLCDMNSGLEALAPAMEFMKARPESPEALALLRRAIKKTPGSDTNNSAFIAAKDLAAQYGDLPAASGTASKMPAWLMPGMPPAPGATSSVKTQWTFRDDTLPTPPVDRYVVRQAVAVPVGDNLLLVDADTVDGALDIMVRIDKNTVVPAVVRKITSTGKTGPMPALRLLAVPGYAFAPLSRDEATDLSGKNVTIYGLGMFEEMGSTIRDASGTVAAADSTVKISGRLLPGEATAPVVFNDQLVGFLTGRTDATKDGGGTEEFIPLGQINAMIKLAPKTGVSGGTSKLKRNGAPVSVDGKAFVVYAISGETFEEK